MDDLNKKQTITIIVLLLIVIVLLMVVIFKQDHESQSKTIINEVTDNSSEKLSDNNKKEILSLFGLTLNGLPKIEFDNTTNKYVSLDYSNIFTNFIKLETNKDIFPDEIPQDIKENILTLYALKNNYTKQMKTTTSKLCESKTASDNCEYILEEDYNELKNKYSFSKEILTQEDKQDDKYILSTHGSIITPGQAEEKITFENLSNQINLIYELKFTSYDENNIKSFNKKFTFKFLLCNCEYGSFNINGEYYMLSNIKVVNK